MSDGSDDALSATDDATAETAQDRAAKVADDAPDVADETSPGDERRDATTGRNYRRYLNYAVLAGLLLLAFVAALQLYLAGTDLIRTWVEPEYRPAFRAAFNLAVLLVVAVGISYQLGRIGN